MCGFVGVAAVQPEASRNWLDVASARISHRGPDGSGEWWSDKGNIGLAHRRLAVIDLSEAGAQPMVLEADNAAIVFNGEIYNHHEIRSELEALGVQFCSRSDTEVLLKAYLMWGRDCLPRLNGMFAFVIYDGSRSKIFAARDRAGEKPFFYSCKSGRLTFASELKALMADPKNSRRVAPLALDCYLANGYIPGDLCILEDCRKLPPAHFLEFDLNTGQLSTERYWTPPVFDSHEEVSEEGLREEFEELIEKAVRRQMIADVPVGVLLSGGVDSSLITAMAARQGAKFKTFTVRFPGHAELDETEHARLIARYFDTEHIELEASEVSANLFPRLALQFDEPIVDSSMIPTHLVTAEVRKYCTVALGGDGGDELFGGYGHHSRLLWLQNRSRALPPPLRALAAEFAKKMLPVGFKGRNWLQALGVDFENGLPRISSLFEQEMRHKLVTGKHLVGAESLLLSRIPGEKDLLQRVTRMDFENYLSEDILVKVDRASMLNSLEMRAPFLDVELLDFAFAKVPSRLKATESEKKILPKCLTQSLLPKEFDRTRKQGFSIPLAAWLKDGKIRELAMDALLGRDAIFDRKEVMGLVEGLDKGRSNSERIFALFMFELWREQYGASI